MRFFPLLGLVCDRRKCSSALKRGFSFGKELRRSRHFEFIAFPLCPLAPPAGQLARCLHLPSHFDSNEP